MDTFGLEYFGFYVRDFYLRFFKKEKILKTDLWKKTKYVGNIGFIKTSNHNIVAIFSMILLILILLGRYLAT